MFLRYFLMLWLLLVWRARGFASPSYFVCVLWLLSSSSSDKFFLHVSLSLLIFFPFFSLLRLFMHSVVIKVLYTIVGDCYTAQDIRLNCWCDFTDRSNCLPPKFNININLYCIYIYCYAISWYNINLCTSIWRISSQFKSHRTATGSVLLVMLCSPSGLPASVRLWQAAIS